MPANRSIVAINYTAPEINHLAAELAATGLLKRYVRPYANQRRGWERWLESVPALGASYRKTLGRRVMPEGFAAGQIRETARLGDFALAALRKVPGPTSNYLGNRLHWDVQRQVAAVSARDAVDAEAVVGSYVVAEKAFEATEGCRILNYPIAHHRYIRKFVAEEAVRAPAFASTLPGWTGVPAWVEPGLDKECELADYILVGSTFVRDSFVSEGIPPEKLVVVPYGADVSRFSPPDPALRGARPDHAAMGLRLLFVGQLGQRKGLSYLLRAYEIFAGPGTSLTLVGDHCGDANALIPYRDMLHHIPQVPQAALPELYHQADVFVFPTLIEGMPLVVLEAMASGLPVITTPNGPGDVVRDGIDGFVVPIRDPGAIIEKLEFLRANPDQRAEMGRNARERALCFTWQAYRRNASRFLVDAASKRETPSVSGVLPA